MNAIAAFSVSNANLNINYNTHRERQLQETLLLVNTLWKLWNEQSKARSTRSRNQETEVEGQFVYAGEDMCNPRHRAQTRKTEKSLQGMYLYKPRKRPWHDLGGSAVRDTLLPRPEDPSGEF